MKLIGLAALKICFNQKYQIPSFKVFNIEESKLENYLGEYSSSQIPLKFKIFKRNNILYAEATDQEPIELEAISVNKFQVEKLKAYFEFDNEKRQMKFKQGNASFIFVKN